ncbi:MAG: TetR/AcrR family transcriptional regulator [Deltaproteobacteria bacterium]|nr:TetR/AcrR family transcriptional regulator [Deltaproteobacteria bacterium]
MPEIGQKERRRAQILEVAGQVFADLGYPRTTIDEIVSRAGVARGTFYLYFKDRRSVFEALVDEFFAALREAVHTIEIDSEIPPLDQLRANLVRSTELARDNPAMLKVALDQAAGLDPELDERLEAFWGAVLELIESSLATGQAMGLVREGDAGLFAVMALGLVKEVLLEWHDRDDLDAEHLAGEILRFVGGGILTEYAR